MLRIACDSILSYAKNNRVKLKPLRSADTSLNDSLSDYFHSTDTGMTSHDWFGLFLQHYFVICKEQPCQDQTSEVNLHIKTCMSFKQQN